MFLAALAGVAVAWWAWYAELNSHSLHFRLVSQIALQPEEKDTLQGLKISIDGVALETPYLSVFELVNDGYKPVTTSAFESPIELHVEPNAFVARARVTDTAPKDLETELVAEKQSVKLKPLLLNPKDTLTIAIITSGKRPQFTTRARIAGVATVPLEDETKTSKLGTKKWVLLVFGFLLTAASWITYSGGSGGLGKEGVYLRPRSAALICWVTLFTGVGMLTASVIAIGLEEFWPIFLSSMGFALVAAIAGSFWNRRVAEKKALESGAL